MTERFFMFRNIEMGVPSQELEYRVRHMSLNNDDLNYEVLNSNELHQITNSSVCSVSKNWKSI